LTTSRCYAELAPARGTSWQWPSLMLSSNTASRNILPAALKLHGRTLSSSSGVRGLKK
jgi:hypothetical protein